MSAIRVTLAKAQGSTPRAAGTSMLVYADRIEGTIGGGALEWEAMRQARAMLRDGGREAERVMPLGPALGQCCGGAVTLRFDRATEIADPPGAPLWIWGAGHVGRAIVATLAPLPDVTITWADFAQDRFPETVPEQVETLSAAELPRLMQHAPIQAHHLILTYSHEVDLALCHAALGHDFVSCGLIGSSTKWARFRKRLGELGHSPAQISRITCPIGDPKLGKHPQAIAIGVGAWLLNKQLHKDSAEIARVGQG